MLEKDLRPCDLCGKPLRTTHDGRLSPFEAGARIAVQRMVLDLSALQARAGLEVMFGGHERPGASSIAGALGPSLDTLEPPELRTEVLLCCGCRLEHFDALVEAIEDRKRMREEKPCAR